MKLKTMILALALLPVAAFASVRVYNNSATQIGTFSSVQAGNGLYVSQVSGRAKISMTGGLLSQTAVSGSLAASQCGTTITSDAVVGAAGDIYTLPAISSSTLGCRYTFVVGTTNAQGLKVDPNGTDQILLLTNAGGDSITADAVGESVVLEAIQPGWAPVGKEQGTWVDSN